MGISDAKGISGGLFNLELREILNGSYVRIKQKITTAVTESSYSV
jgi:hypothetical protein